MKKLLASLTAVVAVATLAACGPTSQPSEDPTSTPEPGPTQPTTVTPEPGPTVKEYTGTETQGITDTQIWIGNTAATTGAFAAVGVPFNVGLEAALNTYNLMGGFGGKTVHLKHYDDEFDGAKGAQYTKQLVEDDKVFALVGHFGTNTVAATVDYIKEQGVPMVYAATGINNLYQEKAQGYNKAVMPVQPIYKTEGRVLLARALAAVEGNYGLGGTKIGVISTTDDAGIGMLEGIKRQAEECSSSVKITYAETQAAQGTNHTAAVNKLKLAQCDVVIIAANQVPFGEILNYMRDTSYNAKVITSYVSANAATLGALEDAGSITKDRSVYTNAWLDVTTEKGLADYTMFAGEVYLKYGITDPTDPEQAAKPEFQEATAMALNSYAMAGYCAGNIFLQGLKRVAEAGKDLTWKNYIDAMEADDVNLPMGGTLSFANGDRLGIAALALNRANKAAEGGAGLDAVSPITTLDEIWSHVPANFRK